MDPRTSPDASDHEDYLSVVRRLPRPTLAQTERFARFVSGAHSWYKHLPVRPKAPFVFYLDPGAGMNRVHTPTGETALVEIDDERTRFHYTWQKTVDYRRRFGHWNYDARYGTRFLYAGHGGVVDSGVAGLRVLTESGDWAGVPADFAGRDTAMVSALVHPTPNPFIWSRDPERFGLADVIVPPSGRGPTPAADVMKAICAAIEQDGTGAAGRSPGADWPPPAVMAQVRAVAAEHPIVRGTGPRWSEWDWPADNWVDRLRTAGVSDDLISAVVKYVEVDPDGKSRYESQIGKSQSPSAADPAAVARRDAGRRMAEERWRQLAAMTDAMTRVLDAVFLAEPAT